MKDEQKMRNHSEFSVVPLIQWIRRHEDGGDGLISIADPLLFDEQGRITLPSVFREMQNISIGDHVTMYIVGDGIIMEKQAQTCVFCGADESLKDFKGKIVCDHCAKELVQTAGNRDRA